MTENCFCPSPAFVEFGTDELEQSIPDRFEKQVAKYSLHLAIKTRKHTLTYAQLNSGANVVAREILSQRGERQEPIGLLLENDAPMIAAILGALKAGKTYVPLDPSLPSSRLSYILQDSQAGLLITDGRNSELAATLTRGKTALIDLDRLDLQAEADNPRISIPPDSPAWIIYTSGSTGQPKGVVQTHRNVLHFVSNYTNNLYLSSSDRLSVLYSFAVNGAAHEMFSGLLNGASLHPLDIKKEGLSGLAAWLTDERVTTYSSVPTVFRHFCEAFTGTEQFPDLRFIKLIGEPVSKREVDLYQKHFSRDCILINRLGSTETGTVCWYFIQKETSIDGSSVPVGYSVADNEVLLVDENRKPVAAGEIGEIAVKSRYLSPGYWRQPEQTAKAFLTDPGKGERTYLTGDMGRMLPDGCLLHMGRKDFQIKIRGHRIETSEIEMALLSISEAKDAIVMARVDGRGESRLVAYLLAPGRLRPKVSSLRRALASRLPGYMIPSAFVILESFPVAPNGKVDRGALPQPDSSRPDIDTPFAPPSNTVEQEIARIWSEILEVDPVGIHDDFFELGGHSLAAGQIVSRVIEKFQSQLTLTTLFEAPTVAAMAKNLEAILGDPGKFDAPHMQGLSRDGELPLSLAQERLWFLDQLVPNSPAYNIASGIRFKGPLQPVILQRALDAVVVRHETLRTAFMERDGRPVQVIDKSVAVLLPVVDLSETPEPEREALARSLASEEVQRPFDLKKAPLFRAKLLRLGATEYVLVNVFHHIVSDGWSMGVFAHDLCAHYDALLHAKSAALPDLRIQYIDFAVWQRQWLQGDCLATQIAYWKRQLAGTLPVCEFPADRPRPSSQTFNGAKRYTELPAQTADGLEALSRQDRVTLFTTMLAAFITFIHRETGQEDILIGTQVANRTRVESENLIGFFVNLLPIRADVSGNPTFRQLLRRVRDTVLAGLAHQDLPFDKLVAELNPKRDASRNPLLQILFVMQRPEYGRSFSGVTASAFEVDGQLARFDLVVFVTRRKDRLTATWSYNTDLFNEATIVRMMSRYQTLLDSIVVSADSPLNILEMVNESDRRQQDATRLQARESRISGLKAVKRKPVALSRLKLITTGYLAPDEKLPLVIQPDAEDVDLVAWARDNLEFLEKELLQHGAILFRGFAVNSVKDFENFAVAICPELFVEYGDLPREQVAGKVYNSTPYPSDRPILFHNESSHMHQWPMKQWFYCVQAARSGGETPIVDCRKLYDRIDPEIRERFRQKKIMYVRNFTRDFDVSWQDFFKTEDRAAVENYCRNASIEMEWRDDSGLRIRHISPAVTAHPKTGEMVWFNQAQLWHLACLDAATRHSLMALFGEDDLPRNCFYGDGSPIEDSAMDHISDAYRNTAVVFPWREKDILMMDNMLVAHGRNPYQGPRKILVAMGEMIRLKVPSCT